MELYAGIDVGTSGIKAVILGEDGEIYARGYRPCRLLTPFPGWAEEAPEDWWSGCCQALKEALLLGRITPSDIKAVCVSSAGAVIPMGKNQEPVGNGVMQMDQRSLPWLDRLRELPPELWSPTENIPTAGITMVNIFQRLLADDALGKKIHCFLLPNGYIGMKLTGNISSSLSRSTTTLLADVHTGKWDMDLARRCGIDGGLLPPLLRDEQVIGPVSRQAAEATGLPEGIPVLAGMMDTVAAGLGCGILEPGQCYGILGTFGKLCLVSDGRRLSPSQVNIPYPAENSFLSFSPCDGGAGLTLSWWAGLLGQTVAELDAACSVPEAEDPLFYFPWMAGTRGDLPSHKEGGAFVGLTPRHRGEHIFGVIMEGVAFSFKSCLLSMEGTMGLSIAEIAMCGGGSRSRKWMKLFANILGRPIHVFSTPDAEAVGAAVLAGHFIRKTWIQTPREDAVFFPDEALKKRYEEKYKKWQSTNYSIYGRTAEQI